MEQFHTFVFVNTSLRTLFTNCWMLIRETDVLTSSFSLLSLTLTLIRILLYLKIQYRLQLKYTLSVQINMTFSDIT